jgi:hypothetical protein
MEWLPTSPDQPDPLQTASFEERRRTAAVADAFADAGRPLYRATLRSLRTALPHPKLRAGPHDFSGAARGAALFATRRAVYEVLRHELGQDLGDVWCSVMRIYAAGRWPCGVLDDGALVVL